MLSMNSIIKRALIVVPAAVLALFSFGCSSPEQEEPWVYRQPVRTSDGWETASLTDVGVDPAPLTELMNRLRDHPGHLVEGIVIVKDDRLVFEEYFDGREHPTYGDGPVSYDRDRKHTLSSVTKSVTATLLGIAVDRGFVPRFSAISRRWPTWMSG